MSAWKKSLISNKDARMGGININDEFSLGLIKTIYFQKYIHKFHNNIVAEGSHAKLYKISISGKYTLHTYIHMVLSCIYGDHLSN